MFPIKEAIILLQFTDGDCYCKHILIKCNQLNWTSNQNKIAVYSGGKKTKPRQTNKKNVCVQNDDLETLICASSLHFPKELL